MGTGGQNQRHGVHMVVFALFVFYMICTSLIYTGNTSPVVSTADIKFFLCGLKPHYDFTIISDDDLFSGGLIEKCLRSVHAVQHFLCSAFFMHYCLPFAPLLAHEFLLLSKSIKKPASIIALPLGGHAPPRLIPFSRF